MSYEIKPLAGAEQYSEYAQIQLNAYPSMTQSRDDMARRLEEVQTGDDISKIYGLYVDGVLAGGMRLFDFTLNYHGQMIPAGGVGGVAVDLLYKKRGLARQLIEYYFEHYSARDTHLALLYPFRPDFYYRMGFGYGPKMNQYEFTPSCLPNTSFSGELVYLADEDKQELHEFYNGYADRNNGYCHKSRFEVESLFKAHAGNKTLIGYREDGKLRAYMAFSFRRAHTSNFVRNNMHVREWIWDSPGSLGATCYFLRTQADQFDRVVYCTQDADFHYLLADVRNSTYNMIPSVYHESNTAGVGIMYRAVNVGAFLSQTAARNFNGITLDLVLDLTDSFRPANAGRYHISFRDGLASRGEPGKDAIPVAMDVTQLSALLMGAVSFGSLYDLGQAGAPAEHVQQLDALFRPKQLPYCITAF